jgi:hypothetical protein
MDIRGGYRCSSLVKQNKKAKLCFVIHIAGEKKLLFYIYFVIVKQKFINGALITTMDFMESAGVFRGRAIPKGATIRHSVSPLEFKRILAWMASRKACGVDGVPAEILKHSSEPFQENLRHLITIVFASDFKLLKETLLAKVILL